MLIGMPGAGKSTIGVILAKVLGYQFIDSDLLIQEKYRGKLKDIIEREGQERFLTIENEVNKNICVENTVIATGGSAVYGKEAMKHLKKSGVVVYIKLSYDTIENRLGNIRKRGVVLRAGQTLFDLYEERCPLYETYADIIINGEGLLLEEVMEKVLQRVVDL